MSNTLPILRGPPKMEIAARDTSDENPMIHHKYEINHLSSIEIQAQITTMAS